jgi:hypothetical protein
MFARARNLLTSDSKFPNCLTGGKIVVADQIYRGRFLFASKNCENNKNTDFAPCFSYCNRGKVKESWQT